MRRVEAGFDGWTIADAMTELRIWLDHYNCVPLTFEILKQPTGGIWLRVEFSDDALAEAFEREFGR
jgi:hypothetical protein